MSSADAPGLDCLVQGHIWVDMVTPDGDVYGAWCLWCGTAAYDGDKHPAEEQR